MSDTVRPPRVEPPWDRAAWYLIAAHVILLLAWWPLLPFSIDLYYHLNVVNAFRDAGGVVLHDVWQFAPSGRPHLYPPALHIALLSLEWLRLDAITLARVAAFTAYVAVLSTTWWFAREWFGSREAYWMTVCSLLPFSYLLVTCNTIAASWALVLWLVTLVAARRGAMLALVCASTLVFYTHLGTPWIMLCSWLVLALIAAPFRRLLGWGTMWTLLLVSPWLLHLWINRSALGPMSSLENRYLELPLLLDLLAVYGGLVAFTRAGRAKQAMLFGVLSGLALLLPHYRFRFFSGQGLLGMSLFAGFALTTIHARLEAAWSGRIGKGVWVVSWGMTGLLFALHTTLFVPEGTQRLAVGRTSAFQLIQRPQSSSKTFGGTSFYSPRLMNPLASAIQEHSRPEDIIGCNLPYTCGLLSALTGRAVAIGMFAEVRSPQGPSADALGNAHLIVWFKTDSLPGIPPLEVLRQRLHLTLLTETEVAYLFKNPRAVAGRRSARAIVPLWLARGILWTLVVIMLVGVCRRWGARGVRSSRYCPSLPGCR
jgi:hypothetical protein